MQSFDPRQTYIVLYKDSDQRWKVHCNNNFPAWVGSKVENEIIKVANGKDDIMVGERIEIQINAGIMERPPVEISTEHNPNNSTIEIPHPAVCLTCGSDLIDNNCPKCTTPY